MPQHIDPENRTPGLNKVQPSGQISNALVYVNPHSSRGHLLKFVARELVLQDRPVHAAIDHPHRLDDRIGAVALDDQVGGS
jgi:hypothetical protein